MITFTNIFLSFLGKSLLEDINFQLNKKEKIGLIGRNGSGKSTLLNLILNRLEPDDGKIIISNCHPLICNKLQPRKSTLYTFIFFFFFLFFFLFSLFFNFFFFVLIL